MIARFEGGSWPCGLHLGAVLKFSPMFSFKMHLLRVSSQKVMQERWTIKWSLVYLMRVEQEVDVYYDNLYGYKNNCMFSSQKAIGS
jgi:hypothetical protein